MTYQSKQQLNQLFHLWLCFFFLVTLPHPLDLAGALACVLGFGLATLEHCLEEDCRL